MERRGGRHDEGVFVLRGHQWDETPRRNPQNWTSDIWCEVYGFKTGIEEGWVGRKDGLFTGKFTGEVDPKEFLHPGKCRNPRERRMLEFMLPILNPEKPKWLTLTVANTLFGALSGVRPVNWGIIIHEIIEKSLPLVGRKTSYLSPFILHLYSFYGCTTVDKDDMLISAEEEIRFRLQLMAEEAGTESNHPFPDATPSPAGSPPKISRRAASPPPPSPYHHPALSPRRPPPSPHAAGPSRTQPEAPWQNVDLSTWMFPETPFQRVYADLDNLQLQYHRVEHITRGVNQALNDCGPGNILRELANRADRKELDLAKKELDRVNMENAHLNAQVAAMSQELNRKTDEIFQGHSEANSARRNFEASAIPWPTRISDWDPIQGGRRGGGCVQFANGCGARGGVQTRKHRKGAGEDSLLSAKEEDHRIREIRTGPVHRSPNRSPINRS